MSLVVNTLCFVFPVTHKLTYIQREMRSCSFFQKKKKKVYVGCGLQEPMRLKMQNASKKGANKKTRAGEQRFFLALTETSIPSEVRHTHHQKCRETTHQ